MEERACQNIEERVCPKMEERGCAQIWRKGGVPKYGGKGVCPNMEERVCQIWRKWCVEIGGKGVSKHRVKVVANNGGTNVPKYGGNLPKYEEKGVKCRR
jgi:hypothetical protein